MGCVTVLSGEFSRCAGSWLQRAPRRVMLTLLPRAHPRRERRFESSTGFEVFRAKQPSHGPAARRTSAKAPSRANALLSLGGAAGAASDAAAADADAAASGDDGGAAAGTCGQDDAPAGAGTGAADAATSDTGGTAASSAGAGAADAGTDDAADHGGDDGGAPASQPAREPRAWFIGNPKAQTIFYFCPHDGPVPPHDGWQVRIAHVCRCRAGRRGAYLVTRTLRRACAGVPDVRYHQAAGTHGDAAPAHARTSTGTAIPCHTSEASGDGGRLQRCAVSRWCHHNEASPCSHGW